MERDFLIQKFSAVSEMKPLIEKNSISATQILYGRVSVDTVRTFINYVESPRLFSQEDENEDE